MDLNERLRTIVASSEALANHAQELKNHAQELTQSKWSSNETESVDHKSNEAQELSQMSSLPNHELNHNPTLRGVRISISTPTTSMTVEDVPQKGKDTRSTNAIETTNETSDKPANVTKTEDIEMEWEDSPRSRN